MPSGWASGRVAFEQSPGCSPRRMVALWEKVVQVDKDTDRTGGLWGVSGSHSELSESAVQ